VERPGRHDYLAGAPDLILGTDFEAVLRAAETGDPGIQPDRQTLLGLRALYFLIEGLLARLVYLTLGLAVILAFIGVKLILVFLHEDISAAIPAIPTEVSLAVILAVLAVTVAASLLHARTHPQQRAHAGALRAHRDQAASGPAPEVRRGPDGDDGTAESGTTDDQGKS
jgi:hypothetical protein